MLGETHERLQALEKALDGDYTKLCEITKKEKPADAAVSLLSYCVVSGYPDNVDPGDLFWGHGPGDYEEGSTVRIAALNLLRKLRDLDTIGEIAGNLYSWGDRNGGGAASTYYSGGREEQEAAVDTLVAIGGEGALQELEKRLARFDVKDDLRGFLLYSEVDKKTVLEAIKSLRVLKEKDLSLKVDKAAVIETIKKTENPRGRFRSWWRNLFRS